MKSSIQINLKRRRYGVLLPALLLFTCSAQGEVILELQSRRAKLSPRHQASFQEQLREPSLSQTETYTGRTSFFETGNSYVQLYPKSGNTPNLAKKDVTLVIPNSMNYDELMEALLKIRSARILGARIITVECDSPASQLTIRGEQAADLNIESLFAIAGADRYRWKRAEFALKKEVFSKPTVRGSDFIIGSTNYKSLALDVADKLMKPNVDFNDLLKDESQVPGRTFYWISASHAPANLHFFQTLAHVRWIAKRGGSVHLITPYLPYARSDKPEYSVGVCAQGKLIADLIEGVGTQGITAIRAHAPQSMGFFSIFSRELTGRGYVNRVLAESDIETIVSPDAGFQKDATLYVQELSQLNEKHVGLVVMNKQRNTDGVESLVGGTGIENIAGKKVVIIDDETASGGTLAKVAKIVREQKPASVLAVVTHLAGSGAKALSSPDIDRLIVTNTVPIPQEISSQRKLQVISIGKEIAEDIQRIEGIIQ